MVSSRFYREGKQEKTDLAALKALIDAIEGKLDDAGFGLSAIVGEINANEIKIDTVDTLADAIKAKTDNLPATPANEATSLAIKAKTDNLPASPANETTVNAIKTQTDKLAGISPAFGSRTQNWQTAEADVFSIGADNTSFKLHSLLLSIHSLAGTQITVRLYMQVNGTERRVYEQVFNATSDPPGLWIVNGTVGIHEMLRVTLQSNNAADNGQPVHFDYMMEAM